ncbi:hypothetical protein BGW80DRAFT_1251664 [Lactifluus volemus]|nr:hypothetical protein BGW80DRAFT_1251664 [Lactifluus volemus]
MITLSSLNLNVTAAIADVVHLKKVMVDSPKHEQYGWFAPMSENWVVVKLFKFTHYIQNNVKFSSMDAGTMSAPDAHTNSRLTHDPSRALCVSAFMTSSPALSSDLCRRRRRYDPSASSLASSAREYSIPVVYSSEVPSDDVTLLPLADSEPAMVLGERTSASWLSCRPTDRPLPVCHHKTLYEQMWKDLLHRSSLPLTMADITLLYNDAEDAIDNIGTKVEMLADCVQNNINVPSNDVTSLPLAHSEFAMGAVEELVPLRDFRIRILPMLGLLLALFGLYIAPYVLCELAGYPIKRPSVRHRKELYEWMWKVLLHRESRIAGKQIKYEWLSPPFGARAPPANPSPVLHMGVARSDALGPSFASKPRALCREGDEGGSMRDKKRFWVSPCHRATSTRLESRSIPIPARFDTGIVISSSEEVLDIHGFSTDYNEGSLYSTYGYSVYELSSAQSNLSCWSPSESVISH